MRFITEFEIVPPTNGRLDAYKRRSEFELGTLIAKLFDWTNKGFVRKEEPSTLRYSLEIEAFPMDKWVEFKQKLFSHLQVCGVHNIPPDQVKILEIIKDLEFYSNNKQAVDTLLNNEAPE